MKNLGNSWVIICAVIVSVNLEEIKRTNETVQTISTVHDLCIKETNTTTELIDKINREGVIEERSLKCYIKCMFLRLNLLVEGHFNKNAMNTVFPNDFIKKHKRELDECTRKAEAYSDLCEKCYDMVKCWHVIDAEGFKVL